MIIVYITFKWIFELDKFEFLLYVTDEGMFYRKNMLTVYLYCILIEIELDKVYSFYLTKKWEIIDRTN